MKNSFLWRVSSHLWKICLQCKRPGFNPWVRKVPWRRKRQPTLVFSPGESHRQRSLEGYSPQGHKESNTTEQLSVYTHTHTHTHTHTPKKPRKHWSGEQQAYLWSLASLVPKLFLYTWATSSCDSTLVWPARLSAQGLLWTPLLLFWRFVSQILAL